MNFSRRVPLPLLAAALALVGALASTVFLYSEARRAADTMIDQRLLGAGNAAALLLGPTVPAERLRTLMDAESLDGAFLIDSKLVVVADANGPAGQRADLLRIDPERVATAVAGEASIGHGYEVGGVNIRTGYFPVREGPQIVAVLALEAGASFGGGSRRLDRALLISVLLALLGAAALALVAARQQLAQQKVARAELLTQIAAAAAHEIRNPLGVIRGTVELMREREGLDERGRSSLSDVLGEVERLKQLTEDLLDLSADRPLSLERVGVHELLTETVAAAQVAFPNTRFRLSSANAGPVHGDAGRLRQVFLNLFHNAAQAAPNGKVTVTAQSEGRTVRVSVADDGQGISPEIAARLFEPFATAREGGTGLGLAVSRRFVERHGGTLCNVAQPAGARFDVVLPVSG